RSDLTVLESINLAAVLVDFSSRPYLRFKKTMTNNNGEEQKDENITGDKNTEDNVVGLPLKEEKPPLKPRSIKLVVVLALLFLLVIASYTIVQHYATPNCMTWKEIQFESVDCEDGSEAAV